MSTAYRLAVRLGGVGLLLNLLACAGLLAAVAGASTAFVVATWVASAAVFGVARHRALLKAWSSAAGLGDQVVARLAVAVSALALTERAGGDRATRAAACLVVGVALAEPVLRRVLVASAPVAANLPGVPHLRTGPVGWGTVFLLDTAGVVVLALVATTGLSPAVALAVAAAAGGALVAAAIDGARRGVLHRRAARDVNAALEAHEPVFALHWQAAPGTSYQIGMWLPYLERLDKPFVVVVRTAVNLTEATALTSAPVVMLPNADHLDDVIVPTLRTVFYVNNSPRNTHMVRFPHLTHIQLNHGESDKAPSFNPVFRMYDRDFVAGQAAIDRFAANGVDMPEDLFTIVGRPQVENVAVASRLIASLPRPTVLYAPTWAGFNADSMYSSLGVGVELVRALVARGCDVVFRPHPYARRTAEFKAACHQIVAVLEADRTPGAQHVHGERAESGLSLSECFNLSDAMVSDVSSVVADYLYSEKPFAMVAVSTDAATFPEEFPLARAAYVLGAQHGRLEHLGAVLENLLGADPMLEVRRSLKTYYLGDFPSEGYSDNFLAAAEKYV